MDSNYQRMIASANGYDQIGTSGEKWRLITEWLKDDPSMIKAKIGACIIFSEKPSRILEGSKSQAGKEARKVSPEFVKYLPLHKEGDEFRGRSSVLFKQVNKSMAKRVALWAMETNQNVPLVSKALAQWQGSPSEVLSNQDGNSYLNKERSRKAEFKRIRLEEINAFVNEMEFWSKLQVEGL